MNLEHAPGAKPLVCIGLKNWLNFRVRNRFEIQILIVQRINTTYTMCICWNFELESAIIWKLVTCQQITSKNTQTPWVDPWARETVMWYWSADTLFWQLSTHHNNLATRFSAKENADCPKASHFFPSRKYNISSLRSDWLLTPFPSPQVSVWTAGRTLTP